MKYFSADNTSQRKKAFYYEDGKIYFSKATERRLFFILTLIMLVAGIIYKLRIFQ